MSKTKEKRKISRILFLLLLVAIVFSVLLIATVTIINIYVVRSTEDQIIAQDAAIEEDLDCIIVLGAFVYSNGEPSPILKERLDTGISLYKEGVSDKLLLSGDNGQKEYNEVIPMREYALKQGVPDEDIYLDYAGFSTYESMYRLRDIFQVEKAVVVTQTYHLYRALYIGNSLDLNVVGVSAPDRENGQKGRDIREVFARVKSVGLVLTGADPTYLGDTVSLDVPQNNNKEVMKE